MLFHWLKLHCHCKIKKQYCYNLECKVDCVHQIGLHVLCKLILIYTVQKKLLLLSSVGKELKLYHTIPSPSDPEIPVKSIMEKGETDGEKIDYLLRDT